MSRIDRWAVAFAVCCAGSAWAGQAPLGIAAKDMAVTSHDRVYAAEQFSNTVSVIDPIKNETLGVIRLGESVPANLSPLYRGQLLVHGMGYSPDSKTLAVVSIGSNSVTFIDTATNAVKHTTYVGRSPHEAFFTPDGSQLWVTVRGEDYIAVLDPATFEERGRIKVPNGPGMQIFSPDGKYGYVCSSFNPETVVIDVASHEIVGHVKQETPFCPDLAASPSGKQVWFTLKDSGKVQVFDARPPFSAIRTIDTGPITNHVNFAVKSDGEFAYVTVGGLNVVKVFRTDDFRQVTTIPVGSLPHGLWPSGDGSRIYVGLENADAIAVIDTSANRVVATIPAGQAAQALVYVANAVPAGEGRQNLAPLTSVASAVHLHMSPPGRNDAATTVALFDQGLIQVLQAAVTGLQPGQSYVLALSERRDRAASLQPLAEFKANAAGAAIVNALGPIRQVVRSDAVAARRYLMIVTAEKSAAATSVVQVQQPQE